MKLFIRKYCTIKTLTVVLLLLSFNLVSFGQDIHNCLCVKTQKVVKKHSCCSKESRGCSTSESKEEKNNCPKKDKNSCGDCRSCAIDNKAEKEEGTLNESKLPKPGIKLILLESRDGILKKHTNQITYRSDTSPGLRQKVFLDISSLRI